MHVESEITIARPRREVFDYLARSEYLPEYASDFVWVKQTSAGDPGPASEYAYEMKQGAKGTFRRTEYEPYSKLGWQGPAAKAGPGTIAPSGSWNLSDADGGTRIKLVMSPTPGGLLRLLSPIISRRIARDLPPSLMRLRQRLEGPSTAGDKGGDRHSHADHGGERHGQLG
jgi:uncharacterized protein YndB with AHSA1/START domain